MQGRHPFLERLERGPILCDGAMGSYLYEQGVSYERCFEELNVTEAERIIAIHLDYITAGAEIVETNTFGANRFKLAEHGLEDHVRRINRAGAKLARDARDLGGRPVFIAGSIGPLGRTLAPIGSIDAEEAAAAFVEQAEGLLESGVDLFMLETISDLAEMRVALTALRGISDLPIVAQMAFSDEGTTRGGDDPTAVARVLRELGADVVGLNCVVGPADALDIVSAMRESAGPGYYAAQPNAGLPRRVGDRFIYVSTPEYVADYARRCMQAGVTLIGGCCGSTPEHIAAMRAAMNAYAPDVSAAVAPSPRRPAPVRVVDESDDVRERGAAPRQPTVLARLFAQGRFVVSTEMRPPRGVRFTKFLQNAEYLRDIGVDAINITDNAMARVRMSNVAAARLIQEHVGVETIIHFTPRDRNLMAVQSDVIGAHATGIRNILAVTGDPPGQGDFPNVTGNWDVDSIGLIAILHNMNEGLDGLGRRLGDPASFFVGCAATPSATDLNLDLERLHKKIEAGAQFIMTQPVFEAATLTNYIDAYEQRYGALTTPIMVCLQPLHSYRMAEKFHNEVPGVVVPDWVRARLRDAGEDAASTGVALTLELIDALHERVQGAYIMPFDRYELAGELLTHIRTLTAPLSLALVD